MSRRGRRWAGTRIFRAVGEVNEVREVLRRCLEEGVPLDEVELLHTDVETYVPLIHELSCRLFAEGQDTPPVTFAEGLPVRTFRPGRALLAWVSWVREGFPQATLVRMVQDGLLVLEDAGLNSTRLGAVLRSVAIGAGRERYRPALKRARAAIEERLAEAAADGGDHPERTARQRAQLEQRRRGLRRVHTLVQRLLTMTPTESASPREILLAAATFLEDHVRCASQLDEYAGHLLLKEIRSLARLLEVWVAS